ncbi:MAG: hypothetical protein EZS28_053382, partial [Streblomastix strix]
NEQPESESISSLTKICSSLQSLSYQIRDNNTRKQVTQIPKLLQSLSALSLYRLGIHLREDIDQQRLEVRSRSRWYLRYIQEKCDKQVQTELVNNGYGRVMSLSFSTAGGKGEGRNKEIEIGLMNISDFVRELHQGRNNYYGQPPFQPLPLLARNTEEQMEEEGANEEVETQMNNYGWFSEMKSNAKWAKAMIINRFIYKR